MKNSPTQDVRDVLNNVYRTLDERGYNAVNQIVGYFIISISA